jgi:hypothetical protein
MGFPGYRRSIRASLAYVGMAAATASALVVLQSGAAFADDAITVSPGSDTAITATEGQSTGSKEVATFTDSGNPPAQITAPRSVTCESAARYSATIDWGDGTSPDSGTVNCTDTNGTWAVWGSHTYKDSGTFHISVTVTDKEDSVSGTGTNTATAKVDDAEIFLMADNSNGGTYTTVEGNSITVVVDFLDTNSSFSEGRDAGITGTINWGDGTVQTVAPTAPSGQCECRANFEIRGSHVYDAPIPAGATIPITVTAKDDGGSTATDEGLTAAVADGALTAGGNVSLATPATVAFTSMVGSFTDEAGAQASAADFAATINWGDGTTSTGTVTSSLFATFRVSGSHTYATAGTKSITATVTDQEGSTVTLKATATVGPAPVAPVVLPATGQPTQPSAPFIPLAIVILGLVSLVAGGRILAKMPR